MRLTPRWQFLDSVSASTGGKSFKPGWNEQLQADGTSFSPKKYTKAGEIQTIKFSAVEIRDVSKVKISSNGDEKWTPDWVKVNRLLDGAN